MGISEDSTSGLPNSPGRSLIGWVSEEVGAKRALSLLRILISPVLID